MNEKYPLVSVIVPAYNSKYIRETLNSILDQTYENIEIIVVNDGSTDNTADIVSGFKNVRLISTDNRGAAAARNTGLNICKGDMISFLDSDDIWIKEKTERQVGFLLNKKDCDVFYGRFENFFHEGAEIPPFIVREKFLDPENGRLMTLGSMMIRRGIIGIVGDFNVDLRTGEDLDWIIKVKDKGLNVVSDDKVVLRRRLHDSNLSYESFSNKSNLLKMIKSSLDRKRGT
ncbi:MAG: glycosyltransferase family A protein [Acidobacteriota bacterium]